MSRSLARSWQSVKDMGGTFGLAALVMAAGIFAAFQFVGPPPPDRISLATGQAGGAYQAFGERYAELLLREGITVELRESAGSVENLQLLDNGEVDIGFVQSGLAGEFATSEVVGLGTLYLEPLWLFLRKDLAPDDIGSLAGQRIAIGASGSGTRAIAFELLKINGLDEGNSQLLEIGDQQAAKLLRDGGADAAFFVGAADSEIIQTLTDREDLKLFDFKRSQAYTRIYRFLSPILLPEGVLDLEANLPPQDVHMIAPGAILAANSSLHPALVDLLLIAAGEIHGGDSLLARAGDFPTSRYVDLPLSPDAERHFEFGPPFLMRYLPFWAATLVDRLWVLLLPLIGLAIPLFKLVLPAYRWRIRRRLLRMYRELDSLDPAQVSLIDDDDQRRRYARLESIDQEVAELAVPRGYTDDVYKLRRDVDLMRRRLHSGDSPD